MLAAVSAGLILCVTCISLCSAALTLCSSNYYRECQQAGRKLISKKTPELRFPEQT